jgi:hypothetical protein
MPFTAIKFQGVEYNSLLMISISKQAGDVQLQSLPSVIDLSGYPSPTLHHPDLSFIYLYISIKSLVIHHN